MLQIEDEGFIKIDILFIKYILTLFISNFKIVFLLNINLKLNKKEHSMNLKFFYI